MFIDARELPLPQEYRFLPLTGLVSEPPDDVDERTIVFLDCGNLERNPAEAFRAARRPHPQHRPPPRQHPLRDRQPGGARGLLHRRDRLGPDAAPRRASRRRTMADALYVGLITDTGRFMYENTGRRAHLMAAELIDAGVDVHEIYRRVYEGVPYGKLALLARGLANVERYDDGRLTMTDADAPATSPTPAPRRATPRASSTTCAPSRAPPWPRWSATGSAARATAGRARCRCAPATTRIDVSAIARAQGGGGHRQAAGFSTELSYDELVPFLREQLAAQL